jgi:glutamate carboxypeptidase
MVRLLERFARSESPSGDKAAVDGFGRIVAREWRRRGAKVRILGQPRVGNHVRAELWLGEGRPAGQILVLGHLDTVYPLGTLRGMPFRLSGGRAWGPGTFDMKGGLVLALFAVDALVAVGARPPKRVVLFWNSDEEIGSETSRRAIEHEAQRSDAVLVLEPAFGRAGKLKTARKGVGGAEIIITGRAAHAGLDPGAGVNAVHARAEVDIRYARPTDQGLLSRKLEALRPILRGARVRVRGAANRPPLERTDAVIKIFRHAKLLMRELGLPLGETATGGGSDGCFTAALGVPTLDGLGAVGGGAHSSEEHVMIGSLPERAALLAGLLLTL